MTLRPRDLAMLLLASGDLRPRERARAQQADLTGLELKRRVLGRLAALDPEPTDLDAALQRIVDDFGPPSGPVRAIASSVRDEWQAACVAPEWLNLLLSQAVEATGETPRGR